MADWSYGTFGIGRFCGEVAYHPTVQQAKEFEMIALLLDLFYQITGALLVPVMVLLLLLFVASLVGVGIHLGELLQRWRSRTRRNQLEGTLRTLEQAKDPRSVLAGVEAHGFVGRFLENLRTADSRVSASRSLDAIEDDIERRVGRATLLIRAGPTLGLMGTLIPMGPALKNLATGDVEGMSEKLIIAFSTTVLGLTIGALALMISSVRRRWYTSDLRLCDTLLRVGHKTQNNDS